MHASILGNPGAVFFPSPPPSSHSPWVSEDGMPVVGLKIRPM